MMHMVDCLKKLSFRVPVESGLPWENVSLANSYDSMTLTLLAELSKFQAY